jgi:hypothetical protein
MMKRNHYKEYFKERSWYYQFACPVEY